VEEITEAGKLKSGRQAKHRGGAENGPTPSQQIRRKPNLWWDPVFERRKNHSLDPVS
jgi:hypothetical protein